MGFKGVLAQEGVMSSEAWEDLGYRGKAEWRPLRIPMCPVPNHQHEPKESTEARRLKSLKAILAVLPSASIDPDGILRATIPGAKFEFWAASDTWCCSSAKGTRFGSDIQRLCDQIARELKQRASSSTNQR